MTTNIVRNDRGLDYKRIEKLIEIFKQKAESARSKISKMKDEAQKVRRQQAYEHFGLLELQQGIAEIDEKIKELKQQRQVFENKIRDVTQGLDENQRYNTYDTIREGSDMYAFIHAGEAQYEKIRKEFGVLIESIHDQLWLARDIDEAIDIVKKHEEMLEKLANSAQMSRGEMPNSNQEGSTDEQ